MTEMLNNEKYPNNNEKFAKMIIIRKIFLIFAPVRYELRQ